MGSLNRLHLPVRADPCDLCVAQEKKKSGQDYFVAAQPESPFSCSCSSGALQLCKPPQQQEMNRRGSRGTRPGDSLFRLEEICIYVTEQHHIARCCLSGLATRLGSCRPRRRANTFYLPRCAAAAPRRRRRRQSPIAGEKESGGPKHEHTHARPNEMCVYLSQVQGLL